MTLEDTTTIDAERIVLAAMLTSKDAVWDVLDAILPSDFETGRHEVIARTIVKLANLGAPCDPVAVLDELHRSGLDQQAGGDAYVMDVYSSWTGSSIGYYAEMIRDRSTLRRLRSAGSAIFEMASGPGEAAELAERARAQVDAAASRTGVTVRSVGETIDTVLDSISAEARYAPTPWREVNQMIDGFHPGRLYVIGARPASGKTIMALQAAVELCRHGVVAFSSLEMEQAELQRRLLAMTASVDLTAIARNTLTRGDWERLAGARARIAGMQLYVDDRADQFVTQIKAHARTVSRRGPLAGVVVDYVGLIATPDDKRARWEHIGQITRQLKITAKELHVPVIVLAQLSREHEGTGTTKGRLPTLRDLRESGNIEQDADVVILLQRRRDKEGRETSLLDLVFGKNRHGRTGMVTLHWEGQYARVVSPEYVPDVPSDRVEMDFTEPDRRDLK